RDPRARPRAVDAVAARLGSRDVGREHGVEQGLGFALHESDKLTRLERARLGPEPALLARMQLDGHCHNSAVTPESSVTPLLGGGKSPLPSASNAASAAASSSAVGSACACAEPFATPFVCGRSACAGTRRTPELYSRASREIDLRMRRISRLWPSAMTANSSTLSSSAACVSQISVAMCSRSSAVSGTSNVGPSGSKCTPDALSAAGSALGVSVVSVSGLVALLRPLPLPVPLPLLLLARPMVRL